VQETAENRRIFNELEKQGYVIKMGDWTGFDSFVIPFTLESKAYFDDEEESLPLSTVAKTLKKAFSSDYLSEQIETMLKMSTENPTEAIGKAKELIESCCITILEKTNIATDTKWNVGQLVDKTMETLGITPKQVPASTPDAENIKAILGNLRAIAGNIAELRNTYGSGHGKGANYKGLPPKDAKLAVGASITLVNYLWETYEWRKTNVK